MAELMRTAKRIMGAAGWGWSKDVQKDAAAAVSIEQEWTT
jgi:hypothetical protein